MTGPQSAISSDTQIRLTAYGTGLRGTGYPNAVNTLELLRQMPDWQVVDRVDWLPEHLHLWRLARGSLLTRLGVLSNLVVRSLAQALRLQFAPRTPQAIAYVPYPSLFVLLWLSWMPRRRRQCVIADAFISVWDSMFRDRTNGQSRSLASRLLRRMEGRALRSADLVLVDTEANAARMVVDFELEPHRVRSAPLAIDEAPFLAIESHIGTVRDRVRVLFVGTMIPLHGIDVVLNAIHTLRDDTRIEFRLIGDGQLSDHVECALRECDPQRVTWLRGWQRLDVIAREIDEADICLGIFGGSEKAARVLPFKLYMYFAAGRPVVSQRTLSTPAGAAYPPIEHVDLRDSNSLSLAILNLIDDHELRNSLGAKSRKYYNASLCNARLKEFWSVIAAVSSCTRYR